MRLSRSALLLPFVLAIAGCGPTLTRGPAGWSDPRLPFSIAPLDDGALFTDAWTLDGYAKTDGGFRHTSDKYVSADLELHRKQDDGALFVASYPIAEEDQAKRPEVLAERWIDRVVQNPKEDDEAVRAFEGVVPPIKVTATGSFGFRSISSTVVRGRDVQIDRRAEFTVPGGEAWEMTAALAPAGSSPDRRLYVAAVKNAAGDRFALVAYGNTPTMFDAGLADATSFAHRVHF